MQIPPFGKLKVLVADPSAFMSGLIAGMLRTAGIKAVVEVNDSDKALRALTTRPFDILLFDLELHPVGGAEATRQLRQGGGVNRDTPVFLVFSSISRKELALARDAGVTEFIQKPVSAAVLEQRLKAGLANPRPFVEAPAYAGPDRRRRPARLEGPERRKSVDDAAALEDLGPAFK